MREELLAKISERSASLLNKRVFVGFDGCIDHLISVVDKRHGPGTQFSALETIEGFGQRISESKGAGTNIELFLEKKVLGGNGPNFSNGLKGGNIKIDCVGLMGDPLFEELGENVTIHSLGEPCLTEALEFKDGKVMLGYTSNLDEVTYSKLVEVMGEGLLGDTLSRADLFGFMNWTMTPHLPNLLQDLLDKQFAYLPPHERIFFFDLCDPSKRDVAELASFLKLIQKFTAHGKVILSLNRSEAEQVHFALKHEKRTLEKTEVERFTKELKKLLDIDCVVIHLTHSAACCDKKITAFVEGPYCENPKITTGGGDIFNAGFALGQLMHFEPEECLELGVHYSGYFVREGKIPGLLELR